jgi:small GTP-binding protein
MPDFPFIRSIVLVGDEQAGKTALINRLRQSDFDDDYKPTIGIDFFVYKKEPIKLQVWDTSGNKRFQPLIPCYTRSSSNIVYVLDSTQELEENKRLLLELRQEITKEPHLPDVSELIVFSKSDHANSKLSKDYTDGFNDFNIPYLPFSAKTEEGLEAILDHWINDSFSKIKRKEEQEKGKKLINKINKHGQVLDKIGSQIAKNKSAAFFKIVNAYNDATQNNNPLSQNKIAEIKNIIHQEKETLRQHRHWSIFNCFFYFFNTSRLENRVTSYKLINKLDCYLDNLIMDRPCNMRL